MDFLLNIIEKQNKESEIKDKMIEELIPRTVLTIEENEEVLEMQLKSVNKSFIDCKDKVYKDSLEIIMYKKLTEEEKDIVKAYIAFLKNQISNLEMNKRDKEHYKKRYEEELDEKYRLEEALRNLSQRYNEVCKKQAETEIELDISKKKNEILENKINELE